MGKGVIADSHSSNYSAARSVALKEADVVLVLGAKLNWILSFGLPPKWRANVKIIQVDICADELGQNGGHPSLSLVGDVALVVEKIVEGLDGWRWESRSSPFYRSLQAGKAKNEEKAAKKAATQKVSE